MGPSGTARPCRSRACRSCPDSPPSSPRPPTAPTPNPGGGRALLESARRYWARRGLAADAALTAAAPGAPALLLALTAATGGDVLLPRPCPAWWAPQARLLGRPTYSVPSPAACGGVPDPYALLETVRRVRAEGGDPRLLVLAVADDPTGTVVPAEVMSRAVEAAAAEGLHVVSDETWRDTVHRPEETPVVGPAEMLPDGVTVICDLSGGWLPPGWPAAVVRFPDTVAGARLRARCLDILTALDAALATPVAVAAAHALDEPPNSPHASPTPWPCTAASPPPCTPRCTPPGPWSARRRPAATSTPTCRRSPPPSPPAASPTPWNWRTTSPPGSGCPPRRPPLRRRPRRTARPALHRGAPRRRRAGPRRPAHRRSRPAPGGPRAAGPGPGGRGPRRPRRIPAGAQEATP
ncbi:aminotransferase class I/II-fold pyridoxal phosphate-dependent enzyme [Streptomyces sp. S399]|uniref:aminotransferase class I/II-fold pyridoxal phosphate-dependent enzyme n=1 Tax=Streptomyces sp. S399 TaxID=3096009 RepID=UPI0039C3F9D1